MVNLVSDDSETQIIESSVDGEKAEGDDEADTLPVESAPPLENTVPFDDTLILDDTQILDNNEIVQVNSSLEARLPEKGGFKITGDIMKQDGTTNLRETQILEDVEVVDSEEDERYSGETQIVKDGGDMCYGGSSSSKGIASKQSSILDSDVSTEDEADEAQKSMDDDKHSPVMVVKDSEETSKGSRMFRKESSMAKLSKGSLNSELQQALQETWNPEYKSRGSSIAPVTEKYMHNSPMSFQHVSEGVGEKNEDPASKKNSNVSGNNSSTPKPGHRSIASIRAASLRAGGLRASQSSSATNGESSGRTDSISTEIFSEEKGNQTPPYDPSSKRRSLEFKQSNNLPESKGTTNLQSQDPSQSARPKSEYFTPRKLFDDTELLEIEDSLKRRGEDENDNMQLRSKQNKENTLFENGKASSSMANNRTAPTTIQPTSSKPDIHGISECQNISAGLSYLDSQEPGEESKVDALNTVDRLVWLNTTGFSQDVQKDKLPEVGWTRTSNAKGQQRLAHLLEAKSPKSKIGIFDWVDSQNEELGDKYMQKNPDTRPKENTTKPNAKRGGKRGGRRPSKATKALSSLQHMEQKVESDGIIERHDDKAREIRENLFQGLKKIGSLSPDDSKVIRTSSSKDAPEGYANEVSNPRKKAETLNVEPHESNVLSNREQCGNDKKPCKKKKPDDTNTVSTYRSLTSGEASKEPTNDAEKNNAKPAAGRREGRNTKASKALAVINEELKPTKSTVKQTKRKRVHWKEDVEQREKHSEDTDFIGNKNITNEAKENSDFDFPQGEQNTSVIPEASKSRRKGSKVESLTSAGKTNISASNTRAGSFTRQMERTKAVSLSNSSSNLETKTPDVGSKVTTSNTSRATRQHNRKECEAASDGQDAEEKAVAANPKSLNEKLILPSKGPRSSGRKRKQTAPESVPIEHQPRRDEHHVEEKGEAATATNISKNAVLLNKGQRTSGRKRKQDLLENMLKELHTSTKVVPTIKTIPCEEPVIRINNRRKSLAVNPTDSGDTKTQNSAILNGPVSETIRRKHRHYKNEDQSLTSSEANIIHEEKASEKRSDNGRVNGPGTRRKSLRKSENSLSNTGLIEEPKVDEQSAEKCNTGRRGRGVYKRESSLCQTTESPLLKITEPINECKVDDSCIVVTPKQSKMLGDESETNKTRSKNSKRRFTQKIAPKSEISSLDKFQSSVRESTRKRRVAGHFCILFSHGLDSDLVKQQKKILERLGGQVTSSPTDCTHFVTDKFVRTRNMLEVMAAGKPVVTPLWLEDCRQASYFVDEKKYILEDVKKEKEIGFSMASSLANAQQKPLLQGKKVIVTPNVKPDRDSIISLVKSSNGQVLSKVGDAPVNNQELENLIVISCEEDKEACIPLLDRGVKAHTSEFLFLSIVTHNLDFSRERLFTNYSKGARSQRCRT